MNKISLLSMTLSFLFCGYLNASEQPASDQPVTNTETATENKVETPAVAEEKNESKSEATTENSGENKSKKTKACKKKKCKKNRCNNKNCKRGDDFTKKLNEGNENLKQNTEEKTADTKEAKTEKR